MVTPGPPTARLPAGIFDMLAGTTPGGIQMPISPGDNIAIGMAADSGFDVAGGMASLTWTSETGATYAIDESPDLTPASWVENQNGISGQAGETTYPFSILPQNVGKSALFFRVRRE